MRDMTMLDIALESIARGWYVFPCWPKTKKPMTAHGFHDASIEEDQIRCWWDAERSKVAIPDANVAISTGPSGLCVADIDHGLDPDANWPGWLVGARTYGVRTGRRPEFGVQLYFAGAGLKSTGWSRGGLSGDIRCSTGYVMAAGSVHPSGQTYNTLFEEEVRPVPDWVRDLTVRVQERDAVTSVDDETADAWKTWLLENIALFCKSLVLNGYEKRVDNGWWLGIECPWTAEHTSGKGADSSTVIGVLDGKLAFECSHSTCKAQKRNTQSLRHWLAVNDEYFGPEPGADPEVRIGTGLPMPKEEPFSDWRNRYHTSSEIENAPPVTFIVENFLEEQGVTALAAPAGQRKSIIALNVAHAACTGEPLFNHFPVKVQPRHTLYLCPEMGLSSFSARLKKIGLLPYVGKTLFCLTMNTEHQVKLPELQDDEVKGALIIVDTLARFVEGDENDSKDMRVFAASVMSLIKRGAAAVLLLHHSAKGTKEATELTLENALRGSGELGAFVACCWATRLQDPEHPYKSASYLSNVKPRDFESDPFEVTTDPTCRMTMVGTPGGVVLKSKFTGNRDGQDDAVRAIVRAHPNDTLEQLIERVKDAGLKRGKNKIRDFRNEAKSSGSARTED